MTVWCRVWLLYADRTPEKGVRGRDEERRGDARGGGRGRAGAGGIFLNGKKEGEDKLLRRRHNKRADWAARADGQGGKAATAAASGMDGVYIHFSVPPVRNSQLAN